MKDRTMCANNNPNNVVDVYCLENTVYTGITPLPENPVTTMAYVPFQTNTTMYSPENALKFGTAFVDLNKPFYAYGGRC